MALGDLITDQWQVQWRDTLLGWPATNLTITDLTGWKTKPNMRSGSVDRTGRHGQFLGGLKASSRQITVDFADVDDDPAEFEHLLDITATGEDDGEEPLVIYLNGAPQLVYARCEKADIPTGQAYSLGLRTASLFFACTDPRRYGIAETFPSVGLPTPPTGGFHFPLVFPLVGGTGPGTTVLTATNDGNTPAWPVLTLTGPLTGPVITNVDTGQQLVFDPSFTIAASEQLVIDTDWRTVTLAAGASRRNALWTADWWPINKGVTRMSLTHVGSYDGSALLSVGWRDGGLRDAYM